MLKIIGVRELRSQLAGVIGELSDVDEVIVTQRGEAKAVIVDLDRYNELLDRLEYLEDSIDAITGERDGAVPADQVF